MVPLLPLLHKVLKLTFHNGSSLDPLPPERSKYPEVRYFHIYEHDEPDERLAGWIRRAAEVPGATLF